MIDIRNESYMFYPQSDIPTLFYAEAGFYYTGNDDISRCFRCGLEIHKLRLGQDPLQLHRFKSPHCRFILDRISTDESHLDASEIDSDNDELNLDSDLDETTTSSTISTTGKIVRRDNIRMKMEMTCRVCNKAKIEILFLPCRHLITCTVCSETMDECLHCGGNIMGTVKTYFA